MGSSRSHGSGIVSTDVQALIPQNNNYNEKADLYAFGITAIEMAFNTTPFDDYPPLKVLLSKLNYPCPAFETKGKLMSPQFFDLVSNCLKKDPAKR